MNCITEFINFFSENPPNFLSDDSTKMRINGKVYDYADTASIEKLFPAEIIIKHNLMDWYNQAPLDKLAQIKGFIESNFRQDVQERKAKFEHMKEVLTNSDIDLPECDEIIKHIQPARIVGDVRREAGFCFIDKRDGTVTPYDYHSLAYVLSKEYDKKKIDLFMAHVAHVQPIYDPFGGHTFEKLPDTNNIYKINKYNPPDWRALLDGATPRVDEDLEKLIEHLFPSSDCREFFYTWVYHSLTSRAGTYLYLQSDQGTGKNTIAFLLTLLHGANNSTQPKADLLKNRFNYYLKDKRFVFLDEFTCRRREDKDMLKMIINDRIQVEGKNRDHQEIKIHASYMIANNSPEAVGLEPVDRRFSVPEITNQSIVDRYGRPWIRELTQKLDDPGLLASFAKYVLEEFKEPRWYNEEPYQTSRFEEIVIATARSGISQTLRKILGREEWEYTYEEERDLFKKKNKGKPFPVLQDWQRFFKDVKIGGSELCEVAGSKIIPVERYRPDDEDDRLCHTQ